VYKEDRNSGVFLARDTVIEQLPIGNHIDFKSDDRDSGWVTGAIKQAASQTIQMRVAKRTRIICSITKTKLEPRI